MICEQTYLIFFFSFFLCVYLIFFKKTLFFDINSLEEFMYVEKGKSFLFNRSNLALEFYKMKLFN